MARHALWLVLAALALPACHDDDDDDGSSSPPSPAAPAEPAGGARLAAPLSGQQNVPSTGSFASGDATFFVPADRSRIDFTLNTSDLRAPQGAQVHVGSPGLEGPAVFDLSTTAFPTSHQGTLRPDSLRPQPSFGIRTFDDAIDALLRGDAYVSVPTLNHPAGEIRGQIGPAAVRTTLSGASVVPPVATGGSGSASLALSADQTRMTYALDVSGLSGPPLAARLHVGSFGLNGPAIFDLSPGTFDGSLRGSLGEADLRPQPLAGVVTFRDAVDALLSGRIYVVVPTTARPSGEIRGQFGPTNTFAPSSPSAPPLFSPGLGSASFVPNEAGTEASFAVNTSTLNGAPLGVVLVALGADGPTIFVASAALLGSTLNGTFSSSNFVAQPRLGINTFSDALQAMNSGAAFARVPTSANPAGASVGVFRP